MTEVVLIYKSFGNMLTSLASYQELQSANAAKRQFIVSTHTHMGVRSKTRQS